MLGENIRNLRKEQGITQADLAEKLGISLDTMSRWENERREPRYSDIIRLAEILQTSPSKLLEGGNNKTAESINLQQNTNFNCQQIIAAPLHTTTTQQSTFENQDIISLIINLRSKIKNETLSQCESAVVRDLLLLCLQDCNSTNE